MGRQNFGAPVSEEPVKIYVALTTTYEQLGVLLKESSHDSS